MPRSSIARQLLDFVERHAAADADIPELLVTWMQHLSAQAAVRGAVRGTTVRQVFQEGDGLLRRFLEQAKLRLEFLGPINAEGLIDGSWRKEAAALREIGNWHYARLS